MRARSEAIGQVAGQRPRQADAGGGAVDGGDEGGVTAGDQPDDPAELVADPAPDVGRALGRGERGGRVIHHPQVAAGREAGVGAGEHDRADRAVGDELLERGLELLHERRAEHVELSRVVERDDRRGRRRAATRTSGVGCWRPPDTRSS
jgi:hypothetical protein